MDYVLNVKRLRMNAVLNSIDGGNGPGTIELRDNASTILATLVLTKPSFYLVGDNLQLCAPTTAFVAIAGVTSVATISDGSGNLVIENMSVGVDETDDGVHDFEIVLDSIDLQLGQQVTIVTATIEHG